MENNEIVVRIKHEIETICSSRS